METEAGEKILCYYLFNHLIKFCLQKFFLVLIFMILPFHLLFQKLHIKILINSLIASHSCPKVGVSLDSCNK